MRFCAKLVELHLGPSTLQRKYYRQLQYDLLFDTGEDIDALMILLQKRMA